MTRVLRGQGVALLVAMMSLVRGDAPPVFCDDEPGPAMSEPAMAEAPDSAAIADDADPATPADLSARIHEATKRGVAWLKRRQTGGTWGPIQFHRNYAGPEKKWLYDHPSGTTSLALYALLKCKEPLDDPAVVSGFKALRDRFWRPGSSYETSMMLLAVTATADPFKKFRASEGAATKARLTGDWRSWAAELHAGLARRREKSRLLGWRYNIELAGWNPDPLPGGDQDLSSTQLAALALLAADRCGIATDAKVWDDLIRFSMQQQEDSGPSSRRAVLAPAREGKPGSSNGPGYAPAKPGAVEPEDRARGFAYIKSENQKLELFERRPTGSMTACGVATIMIARYVLMKRGESLWKRRADQDAVQQSLYDGLAWLDSNWSPFSNPNDAKIGWYDIYYLYSCERALDLVGSHVLGGRHWYAEMAEELVSRQDEAGFWNDGSGHEPRDVLGTCFALLFLSRATSGGIPFPVVTGGGDAPPADTRSK